MQKQKTLASEFSLQGKGLHTGLDIHITFKPAPENHGYQIRRTDLEGGPIVEALAENVINTQRGTVVGKKDVQISTIEHAMAALYAWEVDNCLIEVDAPEFPILDGSAHPFSEGIRSVGLTEQNAPRDYYIVRHKMEVKDEKTGSSLTILPDDRFSMNVLIDFDSPVLSNQYATLSDLSQFADEIAASRTFVFVREIEMLLRNGLIKGGDLDNAIVIYDREMPQAELDRIADELGLPHKSVCELGYVNNKPLAYANEQLAQVIRKDIKLNSIQAPVYDPNREPLMDINRIRELLPHRYPFLLVDKIIVIGGDYIVGIKNVSVNEPFFQGHFPQEPIMPGVLLVEAMAQTGGLLVLNSVDEPERYSTYFMKIDGVKFRQKVVPGDTLIFRLQLISPIRRGISTMKGYVFVGEKVVCEAEFMAQIVKNK